MSEADTIAAIATPPGIGGISVVRVSGPRATGVARALCGQCPPPRHARLATFNAADEVIDQGLVLYFPAPHSFTGEDVVEFQGHGGVTVPAMLLDAVLEAGARLARPGEFSERAFLAGRMDLAQAEALADLIESSSRDAARLAMRSLSGAFSRRVEDCVASLLGLRTFVEAAIDFPDEDIDFLADSDIEQRIDAVADTVSRTLAECERGAMLRQAFSVVLCGAPNVGKSSLLNALARRPRAIVSHTAGTTRDTLDEQVLIDGITIRLVDTAGIRDHADEIEREGIERARAAVADADLVISVVEDGVPAMALATDVPCIVVHNKIDISGADPGLHDGSVFVSARSGEGIDALERAIAARARPGSEAGTVFLARRRHLDALRRAATEIDAARQQAGLGHGELVAESLRLAQQALGEITGAVTSEDLLGEIFGSFCIGK